MFHFFSLDLWEMLFLLLGLDGHFRDNKRLPLVPAVRRSLELSQRTFVVSLCLSHEALLLSSWGPRQTACVNSSPFSRRSDTKRPAFPSITNPCDLSTSRSSQPHVASSWKPPLGGPLPPSPYPECRDWWASLRDKLSNVFVCGRG